MLLTGYKGFIGSRLNEKLTGHYGIDLVDGDDLVSCTLPETDVIYHLAANSSVEESWSVPDVYMRDLQVMARLVKAYPDNKIVFAQSGSIEDISSPYAFSKWACGEYLKKFHTNYVICVFPNVFGGTKGVADLFKGKDEVTIYGDGEQVRDFVHVDDIVEGLLKAQNWPVGEYFMGSGKGIKIRDLAEGKKVVWAPARKEQRESVLPNTTPDWKPTINVFDYIK